MKSAVFFLFFGAFTIIAVDVALFRGLHQAASKPSWTWFWVLAAELQIVGFLLGCGACKVVRAVREKKREGAP